MHFGKTSQSKKLNTLKEKQFTKNKNKVDIKEWNDTKSWKENKCGYDVMLNIFVLPNVGHTHYGLPGTLTVHVCLRKLFAGYVYGDVPVYRSGLSNKSDFQPAQANLCEQTSPVDRVWLA